MFRVFFDAIVTSKQALEEELQLLESDFMVLSSDSPKYDADVHDEYMMALCYNRLHQLRAILGAPSALGEGGMTSDDTDSEDTEVKCKAPLRSASSNWPYYVDNTVFGENYAKMLEIVTPNGDEASSWAHQVRKNDIFLSTYVSLTSGFLFHCR